MVAKVLLGDFQGFSLTVIKVHVAVQLLGVLGGCRAVARGLTGLGYRVTKVFRVFLTLPCSCWDVLDGR